MSKEDLPRLTDEWRPVLCTMWYRQVLPLIVFSSVDQAPSTAVGRGPGRGNRKKFWRWSPYGYSLGVGRTVNLLCLETANCPTCQEEPREFWLVDYDWTPEEKLYGRHWHLECSSGHRWCGYTREEIK